MKLNTLKRSCWGLIAIFIASSSSAFGGDITAVYSNDNTEESLGVFLEVNRIIAENPGSYSFDEARFLMRPFRIDSGATPAGTFTLNASGPIDIFDDTGAPIALPAQFDSSQLPLLVYVSARDTGEASVTLTTRRRPFDSSVGQRAFEADKVRIRIGPFPGLAGHQLATFPFFEFPKAINENSAVESALDPFRHSERIGLPWDIYVVDHKTPSEWAADPTLIDVSGGVESGSLLGSDIQNNTVVVWGSNLQGEGGLEFGVPYDIVYDFGGDGQLDPGDLIDGLDSIEAGFYVVEDPTEAGPLGIASFEFDDPSLFFTEGFDGGSTRSMRSRGVVVHPNPLPPGQLPLVTFSHGNTGISNSYRGYRYLQDLLASYGFITASFDMFPAHVSLGIRWRGWLSNKNTERLILQTALVDNNGNPYPPMGGGIIDNKVDPDRIISVGHSRGGEGVIIQYQQHLNPDISGIRPPNGTLQGFDADSFLGIVPIAQVTFITRNQGSRLDDQSMLMFFGSSDADVCGCQGSVLPTRHYARCDGDKMMTYLFGAGHGYFNELWSCTCSGPNRMTRPEVEAITEGYLFAYCMMRTYGNIPAQDFFTRRPNVFRPIGTEFVDPTRTVVNMYRDALSKGNFVIEDYQVNGNDPFLSSSNQPVSFDVSDLFEGTQLDADPTGGWASNQPDGGFWWDTIGAIFNWNGNRFHYTQTIAPEERDLSDDAYLSFLTCQQSDHPETEGLDGDRDITVTLLDDDGVRSSINTLPYGGIDDPYIRLQGGWGQSLTTYRLRFADFENNGSGIDLKNVVQIIFEIGADVGSDRGRIGLDDIEIVRK